MNKRFLIMVPVLLFALFGFSHFALANTLVSTPDGSDSLGLNNLSNDSGGTGYYVWTSADGYASGDPVIATVYAADYAEGTYRFMRAGSGGQCTGVSFATCAAGRPDNQYYQPTVCTDALFYNTCPVIPVTPPSFGLTYISNNENHFASTTGFTMGAAVIWAADSLYKPFIGSGLAVLYYLRYWILALIIIGAIVYFSYRAFRFFKH